MAEKLRVYLHRKGATRPVEEPPLTTEPGVIADVLDFVRITRKDGAYLVASRGPTISIETRTSALGKEITTTTQQSGGDKGVKFELGSHWFIRVVALDGKGQMELPILKVTKGLKRIKI